MNKNRRSAIKDSLESKIHALKLKEFYLNPRTEKPTRNQRLVFILGGLTFFLIAASLIFLADMLVADTSRVYHGHFGGWHYCTFESNSLEGHICGAGEADCDTNQDCMEGLICVQDVGSKYGWLPGVDVCEYPITTTTIPTKAKGCPTDILFGWDYCSPECPCNENEGDCDSSIDCKPGLECKGTRTHDFGGGHPEISGMRAVDICIRKVTTTTIPTKVKGCPKDILFGWDYCSPECPCYENEGDCDTEIDCKPGLDCKGTRTHDFGGGRPEISGMRAVDICIRKPVEEVGCSHHGEIYSWGYCSESCPCKEGEGDCDSDRECELGLKCIQDAGKNYDVDFNVDVCLGKSLEKKCYHHGRRYDWTYCSKECPCKEGEGDCDSDKECEPGLRCVHGVGRNYGASSNVDVCE